MDAFHADRPETFPAELVARLVDGESPLKVFREYRGLSVERLAELTDLSPATILAIETGTVTTAPSPAPSALPRLATALKVGVDDLT